MAIRLLLIAMFVGAAAGGAGASEIRLRNTYYYVVLEREYAGLPTEDTILAMDDSVIARVSGRFRKAVDIEGTGRLLDGRVINYAGRKEGRVRYLVTDSPYGLGVAKCPLRPFRTVAVDPRVVPLGSLVRIRETVGMRLPGGRVHDGYWHAHDVGGAIKRDRIDLFVGNGDRGDVLEAGGIRHLQALTVEVVEPPPADSCVHVTD